jgi:hypothetical protein
MKKALACVLILAGLVLAGHGFAGRAMADTTSGDVTVSFTLKSHMELTIANATVAFGDIEPAIASDKSSCVALTVKSNKAYKVAYTATDFTKSGGESIGVEHLSYAEASDFTPFSKTGVTLKDNQARTNTTTHTWNYKLLIDYDHAPETYSGTITYTISPAG